MATFTLQPQTISVRYATDVLVSEMSSGHILTRSRWNRARRIWTLGWPTGQQSDRDYIVGFFRQRNGPAESFNWVTIDPVEPPVDAPTLDEASDAGLSQRTYYVVLTYKTALGETTISSRSSKLIQADYVVTVTDPSNRWPENVTAVRVYASESSGSEKYQDEITVQGGTWQEPNTGLLTATAFPTTNDATETVSALLWSSALNERKTSPRSWEISLEFMEDFS